MITMTTQASEVSFVVAGAEDIAIDWGDGKVSNMNDTERDEGSDSFWFSHDCSGVNAHNILITGNVTMLSCSSSQLTALDVSRSTTLTNLICGDNQLTALDVSRNTVLISLDCRYNQLEALDVSANTALTDLDVCHNKLTHLDVSKNTTLRRLEIVGNQFTASALNDLFRTLPDYSRSDYGGYIYRLIVEEVIPGIAIATAVLQRQGNGFLVNKGINR